MPIEDFIPSQINWLAEFTIIGEAQAKGNSRRLVKRGNRTISIKGEKALSFVDAVKWQAPLLTPLPECDLIVAMEIFYVDLRHDLDGSLVLDALAGRCLKNDRQVKELHQYHALDRKNPRVVVKIAAKN